LLVPAPSLRVVPRRVRGSHGGLAVQLASGYGLTADDWQADAVECLLAHRKGGRYAAATGKIAVPRQNGKNGILEIRELFGMVVLGEKFLHTAHEVKTARKAFKRIASFFENERAHPELSAMVVEIRKTNGQEAILLTNGGSIEFIARSSGSGRGFTVDVLVCDEDQDLTDDELAALLPTISAAPLGNPQVILTGTPPDPEKLDAAKGEVARRVRKDAQAGADPNLFCVDYGVPDGPMPDVDDESIAYLTNPALGGRLHIDEVRRERKLMSPEKFARERLGWWGNPEVSRYLIDMREWGDLRDRDALAPARAAVVVDVDPNREQSSIGVAGNAPDGRTLLLVQSKRGVAWLVPALLELTQSQDVAEVALTPGQATALVPELREAGVRFVELANKDVGQGCAAFQEGVREGRLVHVGQPELDAAVGNARTRYVGESEVWDRRNRSIAISPLVACATAAHRWRLSAASTSVYESRGLVTL
jgi:phage terminase large subunit-like protein